jgi:hypothetical protein
MNHPTLAASVAGIFRLEFRLKDLNLGWEIDITINSPFRFAETMQRINDAIASQDDTVDFGIVDFQKQAEEQGTANLTR